jgi:hypothetical protein
VSAGGRSDVVEIYLRLPPAEIAYLKFVLESYEGIAVVRTVDRHAAVLVLLAAPDLAQEARRILEALRPEVHWEEVAPPGAP